jgi:DeoR/GlpR family transcriptional regulator of sugar metabolism
MERDSLTPVHEGADHDHSVSERRSRILDILNREGKVRVADLSRLFGISEVTIRNDLNALERQDMLERVHGGAVRTNKSYYRMTVDERMKTNERQKRAIAGHVATMINEGDTVFLNSGTTAIYISRAIRTIPGILVITNSPLAAQELSYSGECEVVLLGGSYNGPLAFTYGDDAVRQISKYRANRFFLSCDGISVEAGIMTYNTHEVDVNHQFIARSAMVVAVADQSKIGRTSRIRIGSVECLDALITNEGADREALEAIGERGVEIIEI